MIPTTIDTVPQLLLPYAPDWKSVTIRARVEADIVTGLTGRENRRPLGSTLRIEQDFSLLLGQADAAAFRNQLHTVNGDRPVRVPFWPGVNDDGSVYSSFWWMKFVLAERHCGVDSLEVIDEVPTLSGREQRVPTLLGYLTETPRFDLVGPDTVSISIRWKESSSQAMGLTVPDVSLTSGPDFSAPVFPFIPDFEGDAQAGPVAVEVKRETIGFGRVADSAAYPQLGTRKPRFSYTLDRDEAARLIGWFREMSGPVGSFWMPGWFSETEVAAATTAGSNLVTVADATALGTRRYVAFYTTTGEMICRKVNSIAGNVLTLNSSPGDWPVGSLVVTSLLLARFAGPQITIEFSDQDLATAVLDFVEVPEEYVLSGETRGTTIGNLGPKAFLYTITHGAEVTRLTSFETNLVDGSQTFLTRGVEHSDLTDSILWESSKVTLKFRDWPGNPLRRLIRASSTERIEVVVEECNPDSIAATRKVISRGFVTGASTRGPWFSAEVQSFGYLFSRNVPVTLIQPFDNRPLFQPENPDGLDRADWTFTVRATSQSGTQIVVDTVTWPGGSLPAIGANYFALGYAVRPSDGARFMVLKSTAISGGALTLTLNSAPSPAITGAETGWTVIPGYDGQFATRRDKFADGDNFAGFPFAPSGNPSLTPIKQTATSGKK